jgi:hypothetical protein
MLFTVEFVRNLVSKRSKKGHYKCVRNAGKNLSQSLGFLKKHLFKYIFLPVQSSSSHSTGAAFVRSLLNGSCLPAESNICAAQPFALSIAADCAHPRPSSCSERRKTLDCSNGSLGELDYSHQNSMLALKLANLWIDHDASLLDDIYLVSAMYFLEVHLFESVCPFTETVQRLV